MFDLMRFDNHIHPCDQHPKQDIISITLDNFLVSLSNKSSPGDHYVLIFPI